MTVMILQILSYGVYSNVDSSLKMAATKTNSYLEMEMLKRELFLTSEVDQNNTTTIFPMCITLIAGYIIAREKSDDTLKSIMTIPISYPALILSLIHI